MVTSPASLAGQTAGWLASTEGLRSHSRNLWWERLKPKGEEQRVCSEYLKKKGVGSYLRSKLAFVNLNMKAIKMQVSSLRNEFVK